MIFLTITGASKYFGIGIFNVGQLVKLQKDPENFKDSEAIKVILPGEIHAGYVANSVYTVARGTYSAGRLYDKFSEVAYAKIWFVTNDSAIAKFFGWNEDLDKLFSSLKPTIKVIEESQEELKEEEESEEQ